MRKCISLYMRLYTHVIYVRIYIYIYLYVYIYRKPRQSEPQEHLLSSAPWNGWYCTVDRTDTRHLRRPAQRTFSLRPFVVACSEKKSSAAKPHYAGKKGGDPQSKHYDLLLWTQPIRPFVSYLLPSARAAIVHPPAQLSLEVPTRDLQLQCALWASATSPPESPLEGHDF
jgi:hypothetical protein